MKYLLSLLALSAVLALHAEVQTLYPSKADWRTDGKAGKDGVMQLVNTSDKDNHSLRLWMKTYQVGGKSTEFGKNLDLKGTFDWTTLTNVVTIPENFDGWLTIGLREVTGTLRIREVTLEREKSADNAAKGNPASPASR